MQLPRDNGTGMMGVGITLIPPSGLAFLGGAVVLPLLPGLGALTMLASGGVLATGITLTVLGERRHERYREFMELRRIEPRPTGAGMRGTGYTLLGYSGVAYLVWANDLIGIRPPIAGLILTGAAIPLIAVGEVRRVRHRRWYREMSAAPYYSRLPGGGFTFGVAGRF